jgi:signal transduction histidine kinase
VHHLQQLRAATDFTEAAHAAADFQPQLLSAVEVEKAEAQVPGIVANAADQRAPFPKLHVAGFDLSLNHHFGLRARGGNGGFGNLHFTTSTNRSPRRANPGQVGIERRRELESARDKSDFAAHVSHELRSPITQIRLKAEALQLGLATDDVASGVGFLPSNWLRMPPGSAWLGFRRGPSAPSSFLSSAKN